jgi:hypothetical protein
VDQVQPLVLAEGRVPVGRRRHVEQRAHGRDVVGVHLPLDLEVVHGAEQ